MIISFIVLIVFVSIVALGIFCLGLVVFLIQLIVNFLAANILPIVLAIFSLFVLLIILAIFLPKKKETENDIEKKEDKYQEINSQRSTAKANNKGKTLSNREKSNETTIDVQSTVVREQPKSNKPHQKKKSYRASVKHNNQAKSSSARPSFSNETKHQAYNCYATQTSVSQHRVNTESYFYRERTQISYADFSEEVRPKLQQLKLSQPKSTIQSGETIQFKLTGLDQFNSQIEISERISWLATAGKIDSTGLFSIDSINDVVVRVTAKVGTLETTSTVKIESIYEILEVEILEVPQLKSLKVVPDCVYLKPDEEQVFEAIGLDRHNNPIDCGEIIWSATGGIIDQNGKLIAGNNAKGIYQVTATSKHTPKHNAAAKTTLLTLGVSTRILSWAIANEEFFYDVLAPLLNLTNEDDSLSQADALVQSWILEIGRRRVAKLLKKASNLSFKEAFSNISDSIDYIVVPELRKIEFVNLPSNIKPGDRIKLEVIGLDQAGDVINIKDRIIWSVSSSKISSEGIFTAGEKAEDVEVIAKVKNKNIIASTNIKIEPAKKIKYEVPVSIKTNKPFNFRIDKQDNDLLYELLNNWFRNLSDYSYSKIFENLSFELSSYLVFNIILELPSFVTWFDELHLLYDKPFFNNYNCLVDERIENLLYETFDDYFVKLSDDLSSDILEDYLYIISKILRELSFFFSWLYRGDIIYDELTISDFSYYNEYQEDYYSYR